MRILATELEPTSGTASVNGIDVVKEAGRLREKIAIVPQEARPIPWMTPMQTVLAYLLWRGFGYGEAKRRALRALEALGLGDSVNAMNRSLSGGMRRKVLVATVLSSEAEVVFLDEPTTGLDPISRRDFWQTLKEIGKERFTFLTTHYLEEAEELADNIGILDQGQPHPHRNTRRTTEERELQLQYKTPDRLPDFSSAIGKGRGDNWNGRQHQSSHGRGRGVQTLKRAVERRIQVHDQSAFAR